MMILPPSTTVDRFIPKEKFYSKTFINNQLRQHFTDEVEKIIWKHKISPQTLNIAASDFVEMQIIEISLKGSELNPNILKHIDTFIPYPILFILKKPNLQKAVISFKEPFSTKNNVMKVHRYFDTEWLEVIDLEMKGRSVDEIYKNYLHQIEPNLDLKSSNDIKLAVENKLFKEKLIKDIDSLNRAILNEPSISKQQDLARERYFLEQQLGNAVYLNSD